MTSAVEEMTENGSDAGEWEEAVLGKETPTSSMIGSNTWTGNGGYDSAGSNSSDGSWRGTSDGSGSAHIVHRGHRSNSEPPEVYGPGFAQITVQ